MRKALIYTILLISFNILGDILINILYSNYYRYSGIINYFFILIIVLSYYFANLSRIDLLGILLFPAIYFFYSSLLGISILILGSNDPGASELLHTSGCFISSLFELINIFICSVNSFTLRGVLLVLINSVGVSAYLFLIAYISTYFSSKINLRNVFRNYNKQNR